MQSHSLKNVGRASLTASSDVVFSVIGRFERGRRSLSTKHAVVQLGGVFQGGAGRNESTRLPLPQTRNGSPPLQPLKKRNSTYFCFMNCSIIEKTCSRFSLFSLVFVRSVTSDYSPLGCPAAVQSPASDSLGHDSWFSNIIITHSTKKKKKKKNRLQNKVVLNSLFKHFNHALFHIKFNITWHRMQHVGVNVWERDASPPPPPPRPPRHGTF